MFFGNVEVVALERTPRDAESIREGEQLVERLAALVTGFKLFRFGAKRFVVC